MRINPQATYELTIGDEIYNLSSGFGLYQADDGFGSSPLHRLTVVGPMQHGATDVGFRLEPREISLGFFIHSGNRQEYWDKRNELLGLFKPSNTPMVLTVSEPSGFSRSIDCFYSKGLSLSSDDSSDLVDGRVGQKIAVSLVCPDPTWYDSASITLAWVLTATNELAFPAHVPFHFGGDVVGGLSAIVYDGTWLTYPTIYFYGPMLNPTFRNLTTGESISLTYLISAGEMVMIDTRYGYKTVSNNFGVNLIDKMNANSDLATFHIATPPEASGGINVLQAYGSGGVVGTSAIIVAYYTRYIGI